MVIMTSRTFDLYQIFNKSKPVSVRENRKRKESNLIKRTCVLETALPYFIYGLFCGRFVGACGICLHRKHSSPSNAVLEVPSHSLIQA